MNILETAYKSFGMEGHNQIKKQTLQWPRPDGHRRITAESPYALSLERSNPGNRHPDDWRLFQWLLQWE